MSLKTAVIGSGFAGLSAANYLAKGGCEVHVFEKNETAGGRARQLITDNGYMFDMGPSWYWMPDVFERFFNDFGYSVSDFYDLKLLDPQYSIIYEKKEVMNIPSDFDALCNLFESIEKGSAAKLILFLKEAEFKYKTGVENLVYKPSLSLTEFADLDLAKGIFRLQVFSSFSKHVRKYFSNKKLIALMEFPVLFLGASPEDTPALYSLMNYAGLKLGTWYPKGGFGKVIDGMKALAERNGVRFHFNAPVDKIEINNSLVDHLVVNGIKMPFDAVIAAADYHHVEQKLISAEYRNYSANYWERKTFAPSSLIYYLGITKRVDKLQHHNLFFDADLSVHANEIYKNPSWPSDPLFYVCCPSKSDDSVAPDGHENLFLLMPIAPGLGDDDVTCEKYFNVMMERLKGYIGENLIPYIDYKRSYCVSDFTIDYNAFKGNAYGLANTLRQTAFLKPKLVNKKVQNLFYAGQLTVPGPGVPPSIISGKVASNQLLKYFKSITNEVAV